VAADHRALPTTFLPGDLYWYDNTEGPASAMRDPHLFVVMSRYKGSPYTLISPVTDAANAQENGVLKYPYHALIEPGDVISVGNAPALNRPSIVKCDQMFLVEKNDLLPKAYAGRLSEKALKQIHLALIYTFDMEESIVELVVESVEASFGERLRGYSRK